MSQTVNVSRKREYKYFCVYTANMKKVDMNILILKYNTENLSNIL